MQNEDFTIIITGGASGIGAATAKRLAGPGVNLVIAGRDGDRGARFTRDLEGLGAGARFIQTDVKDEGQVESLIAETRRLYGRIDAVFNNAGVEGTVGPMAAWSATDLDDTIDTNVKGAFYVMKHASQMMAEQKSGVILNCASILGLVRVPIAGVYAASKAALIHLTQCAAAELAEQGVTVLALCPTVVDTSMMDRVSARAGAPKSALAEMVCPSGKLGAADTVAGHAAALLRGEHSLESGHALVVTEVSTHPVTPASFTV